MFKFKYFYPVLLIIILFTGLIACDEASKYESCGGQPVCPPPIDDKAPESVKKLRADFAGKWKFVSMDTRDTFHKTEQKYNTQKSSMCISYDGGIQYLRNYTDLVCVYCYELQNSGDTLKLKLDEAGLSKYCLEQFQSSDIIIRNDSMILFRRDSFIVKNIVYKRTNDDGTFKTSN